MNDNINVANNNTMKEPQTTIVALIGSFILGCIITIAFSSDPNTAPNHPVIIWNDDVESIPKDGSKIQLEMTENDTIYIGNIE